MTRFKTILLAAGLSTLLGSAALHAQSNSLEAKVPFDFHVAGRIVPAGTYAFHKMSDLGVFEVRNPEAKVLVLLTAPIPAHYMPTQSKLVFLHRGSDYVLSEIAVAGTRQTNALNPAEVEKNMTRKLGIVTMVSVPLHH